MVSITRNLDFMKNCLVEEKDNTLSAKPGESFIEYVGCYPETNIVQYCYSFAAKTQFQNISNVRYMNQ